ncbi:MAG: hypothetical protein IT288_08635 [Bdellovibrionales bacterium]|nr:hypothetical protein [Bdellovibrionales bacterium]
MNLLVVATLTLGFFFTTWASADSYVVGHAYTSKTKRQLAYREYHDITQSQGRIQRAKTTYKNPDGTTIAELSCDYSKQLFLPDFEFTDHRSGYWEKVVVGTNEIKVELRENRNAKIQATTFKPRDNWSASQGLNQFITSHLQRAVKGEDVVTTFLLPAHLTTVKMLVTGSTPDGQLAQLEIKVKNPILRLFAPRIELVYELQTQRLLTYFGNSNIFTASGDKQTVFIDYDYPVMTAATTPAPSRGGP